MIQRVLRTATGFAEAAQLDRQDIAAMTFEERISEVERLRRIWFGEDPAESRLDRVLVSADRPLIESPVQMSIIYGWCTDIASGK